MKRRLKVSGFRGPVGGFGVALIVVGALAGCGGAQTDGGATAETAATNGDAFDLSVAGLRGRTYTGDATLFADGHAFPDSRFEISTNLIGLETSELDLGAFDDPELEFRGEPVLMRVSMAGSVTDHEPGRIEVDVTRFSLRLLDSDGAALGTNESERILGALESHDVTFPDVASDDTLSVVFEIVAGANEGRDELNWTTDHPHIGGFVGSNGRR